MKLNRYLSLSAAALGLLLCTMAPPALAQSYPTRPIRVIVPFPPGNASDIAARVIADKLSQRIGQPVIIENRAGAQGAIGVEAVVKAPPDGYTLLLTSLSPLVITPSVSKNIPYDTQRDLAPVARIGYANMMLVTALTVPASTVAELVAYIKANPGKLSYGSVGAGTLSMLAMEMFKQATGTDVLHVPYKGSAQALTDMIGGQVTMMIDGMTSSYVQVKAGKVKAIAILSQQRSRTAPSVPTMAESGLPGLKDFDITGWVGMLAPAGTPKTVVDRLNTEVNLIMQQSDFQERAGSAGLELYAPSTPAQFGEFIKTEQAHYRDTAKALHIETP
ncbi:MAG: tripartite tricarboxylate transporter substrate binding protein [Burkholderiaceae bacterium]